jgi:uncharacterized membrane protein YkoI
LAIDNLRATGRTSAIRYADLWSGASDGNRIMKNAIVLAVAVAMALPAAQALAASATCTGHQLAGQAHLTMAQASAIALKARPGTITDQELEKEGDGSGLRYSFDIKAGGKTYEVGVDAADGKVLENSAEGAHPD